MAFLHRCGRSLLGVSVVASLLLALAVSPGQAQKNADWSEPLKGGDLTTNFFTTGNWKLDKEGVVALVPRPGEKGWTRYDAYLWLKLKYKDFAADFEYKVAKNGNSGFYFHVSDLKEPVKHGIEVQIYDSFGRKGALNDHDSGGIIPGVPPTKRAAKPAGEWNRMRVTCKGNKVIVVLNGEKVNEVQLDKGALKTREPSGYVGFQDHGLPLWLRNIKIREL